MFVSAALIVALNLTIKLLPAGSVPTAIGPIVSPDCGALGSIVIVRSCAETVGAMALASLDAISPANAKTFDIVVFSSNFPLSTVNSELFACPTVPRISTSVNSGLCPNCALCILNWAFASDSPLSTIHFPLSNGVFRKFNLLSNPRIIFTASSWPSEGAAGNEPHVPTPTIAGVPESTNTSLEEGLPPGFVIVLVVMI